MRLLEAVVCVCVCEDLFNPAGSLMIPLCECTHSCVLSFPSKLKYVFRISAPFSLCAYAYFSWMAAWTLTVGGEQVVSREGRLYDVPDYSPRPLCQSPPPPPALLSPALPKFTPSPLYIPLAALQPGG